MGIDTSTSLIVGFQFGAYELYKLLNGKRAPESDGEESYEITIPGRGTFPFGSWNTEETLDALAEFIGDCTVDESYGGDGTFDIYENDAGEEVVQNDYPIVFGVPGCELASAGEDWYGYRFETGSGLAVASLVKNLPLYDALAQRIESALGVSMADRPVGIHIHYHIA